MMFWALLWLYKGPTFIQAPGKNAFYWLAFISILLNVGSINGFAIERSKEQQQQQQHQQQHQQQQQQHQQ